MSGILEFFREWRKERERLRAWVFVGFVTGEEILTKDDGTSVPGGGNLQIHSLFEGGSGERRVDTTGRDLYSKHGKKRLAQVKAWESGGPLPPLDARPQQSPPVKGRLLVFTGGKGDAA